MSTTPSPSPVETTPGTPVAPAPAGPSGSVSGRFTGFINDSVREFQKVSWPTREELRDATVVVIVLTMVLSLFIFGVDTVVSKLLEGLIKLVSA